MFARSETPASVILDASALLRAIVLPRRDPAARAWIVRVVEGRVDAHVPDLVFVEVAQALVRYVHAAEMTPERAGRLLDGLAGLPLHVTSLAALAGPAFDLTLAHRLTAYDGCYVALAQMRDAVVVTADQRLAEAAARSALLPGAWPPDVASSVRGCATRS